MKVFVVYWRHTPLILYLSTIRRWVKRVKCTLVQALRLCTGHTAYRGSRGIALPFCDHGTRRGWGVSVTPRPIFTPGKDPVPIVQEAGWATWQGAEILAPTGIGSPDRPASCQSLYQLRCPAHYVGEQSASNHRRFFLLAVTPGNYWTWLQTRSRGCLEKRKFHFLPVIE